MALLLWNVNRRSLENRVARLVAAHQVDIVVLIEPDGPPQQVLDALTAVGIEGFQLAANPATEQRIRIYSRPQRHPLSPVFDDPARRLTVRRLIVGGRIDLLLAVVHVQSRRDWSRDSQQLACVELGQELARIEAEHGHRRTVLMGDFNMNPFDIGVIAANGLHAMMDRRIAERSDRTVAAKSYPFFYNPMWSCLGDRRGTPPGTHYYDNAEPVTYFWNTYDQVLFRPELMHALIDVHILDTDGHASLLSPGGRPDKTNGSDHLPVLSHLCIP